MAWCELHEAQVKWLPNGRCSVMAQGVYSQAPCFTIAVRDCQRKLARMS